MRNSTPVLQGVTIGIDLGDRFSRYCAIDGKAVAVKEDVAISSRESFAVEFGPRFFGPSLVALEAGTHSRWASRVLTELGHEVIVANPRKLRFIFKSTRKCDKADAKSLARVARFDRELLSPIRHRAEDAQADLALIRARAILVAIRTELVNHVRSAVKSFGWRLPVSSTGAFPKLGRHIPPELTLRLRPLMDQIGALGRQIRAYDREVEQLCKKKYPETERLRQVNGVGSLTALAFVLTIDDPSRFEKSRDVGPFFGLQPRLDQSGDSDRQLHITKAGDRYVRFLLVSAAQYILGPFGRDCDLRRFGLELATRGGKNAKKRAVVAVARKLAVLLHRLWVTSAAYEPLRRASARGNGGETRTKVSRSPENPAA